MVEVTSIVPDSNTALFVFASIVLFFVAAFTEIGGGYLVWKWLRERKGIVFGIIDGMGYRCSW